MSTDTPLRRGLEVLSQAFPFRRSQPQKQPFKDGVVDAGDQDAVDDNLKHDLVTVKDYPQHLLRDRSPEHRRLGLLERLARASRSVDELATVVGIRNVNF